MKIIVIGQKFEQVHEPLAEEFDETLRRVSLSVEIWNRERPKNQRRIIEADMWPPVKK